MMKLNDKRRLTLASVFVLALLMAAPGVAYAHGGEPVPFAGPVSWTMLGFGVLVIMGVSVILFTGKAPGAASAAVFENQTGVSGYLNRMRLFSRNARLYMIHIVGMDVIYGTWSLAFNLYLLAIGFDMSFVALRILVSSISAAALSLPAGMISDRVGRKLSFILGDGVGAVAALVAISTTNPTLILIMAALGGMFGSLHGVSEPAFMAENSASYERVHLFSVSDGMRVAASIVGAAIAGLMPSLMGSDDPEQLVRIYRMVAYVGIGGWFASLIPAILLRPVAIETVSAKPATSGLRALFANVVHPDRIWKLTGTGVLLDFGAGFAVPLLSVYFQEGLHSEEVEISAVFTTGQALLVVGALLMPVVAVRLGRIRTIVWTRLLAIPFILALAYAMELGNVVGSAYIVAGIAYAARITLMNMADPVHSAFSMDILHPAERGTQVGLQQALSMAVWGGAAFIGGQLMNDGDFRTPFLIMAALYLSGTVLFQQFFGGREKDWTVAAQPAGAD